MINIVSVLIAPGEFPEPRGNGLQYNLRMATFRILTYIRREADGYQITISTARADVERSVPLTEGDTASAVDRDEALRIRGELVANLISQIQERGDAVIQIRELGDIDK